MGQRPTEDPNLFAKPVFDNLLTKLDPDAVHQAQEPEGKDPKAVAAGRPGGLKGGPQEPLSCRHVGRKTIAKKAAVATWKKLD